MTWKQRIPGYLATLLAIALSAMWTWWGVAELYYEGWWGSWYNRLPYLVPGAVCLSMSLLALTWPRAGAILLLAVGAAFSVWWWVEDLLDGHGIQLWRLPVYLMLGGAVLLIGVLFWLEARRRQRIPPRDPPRPWWQRHSGVLITLAVCALITGGVSTYYLPIVLTREDDGERGIRYIETPQGALWWAPQGPGWNWKQSWGGYPSWHRLALYGVEPVGLSLKDHPATESAMQTTGLCAYLDESGTMLLDQPAYIWRMPTAGEIAAALARHGENAGCEWDGEPGFMDCRTMPDKETPLWAPDQAPIYYWAADAYNDAQAYYVSYNGAVQATRKTGGNPRHGYRCVREP